MAGLLDMIDPAVPEAFKEGTAKLVHNLWFYVPTSVVASPSYYLRQVHSDYGSFQYSAHQFYERRVVKWGKRQTSAFNISQARPGSLKAADWTFELDNSDGLADPFSSDTDCLWYANTGGGLLAPYRMVIVKHVVEVMVPRRGLASESSGTKYELPCSPWFGRVTRVQMTKDVAPPLEESSYEYGAQGSPDEVIDQRTIVTCEPMGALAMREVFGPDHVIETDTGLDMTPGSTPPVS